MRIRKVGVVISAVLCLAAGAVFGQDTQAVALQSAVENVYTTASPSVVNITISSVTYDFFNQPVPQQGTGSGFFYDTQGHIVTNNHVVDGATSISVTLQNQKTYRATVTGQDPFTDLAVIQIKGTDLPAPLPVVSSSTLKVGQFVIAMGNPFGLQGTLTFGVISALGRQINSPDGRIITEAIQTDAPINPGNSGGPLLDLQGRVVGINSQILSPSGANSGIGFAVSSKTIMAVVPQLIATGHVPHPYLGVREMDLNTNMAAALRGAGVQVPAEGGIIIAEVEPGSPADMAGLHGASEVYTIGNAEIPVGGDVLVAINGKAVQSSDDLSMYLDTQFHVGDTVTLTVVRAGRRMDVKLTLGETPPGS